MLKFASMERGMIMVFFFSSRRRHTRLQGDWSSDVCSSDLTFAGTKLAGSPAQGFFLAGADAIFCLSAASSSSSVVAAGFLPWRGGRGSAGGVGRAAGRGRGEDSGGAGLFKKKKSDNDGPRL